MPVGLLSNLDCISPSHTDTPGAGDKGVGELLQRLHFVGLQRMTVLQLVVALLQRGVVYSFNLDLIEIEPQDTMDVSCSPPLELNAITTMAYLQRIVLPEHHLLPEGLHPMLEIACGEEDIPLHHRMQFFVHMVLQILFPWLLYGLLAIFDLNSCGVLAKLVNAIMHCAALLLKLWSKVGAPPEQGSL